MLLLHREFRYRLILNGQLAYALRIQIENAPMPADRLFENLYGLDEQGRSVLIGLSFDETSEFERLDASLPFNGLHVWPDLSEEDVPLAPIELRWRELWEKHEAAMRALID